MNYEIKIKTSHPPKIMRANETKIGDIMQVVYKHGEVKHQCVGHTLLHTFTGFVSLNDPNCTWKHPNCDLKVSLFPPKTKIILKTK